MCDKSRDLNLEFNTQNDFTPFVLYETIYSSLIVVALVEIIFYALFHANLTLSYCY